MTDPVLKFISRFVQIIKRLTTCKLEVTSKNVSNVCFENREFVICTRLCIF